MKHRQFLIQSMEKKIRKKKKRLKDSGKKEIMDEFYRKFRIGNIIYLEEQHT